MDYKRAPWKKALLVSIEIIFAVNIVFLDFWIVSQIKENTIPHAASTFLTPSLNPTTPPVPTTEIVNPLVVPIAPTATPTPTAIPVPPATQQFQNSSNVLDYFIPFGAGSGSGTTWTNVPGLQSYVDTTSYPNINKVTFEVSAQIPTGNQSASIRLFNETAQHPVWFSDVTLSGGDAVFLISQPIMLDPGNNLYQVQTTTQLGYPVTLNQARVHITLH